MARKRTAESSRPKDLGGLDENLRRAVRLLCWEGAFALAYETWLSPTYISGLAGELGVPVRLLSVIVAAPWIGAMGQLVGVWALGRVDSLKEYTLGVAAAARAMWLIPIFLAAKWALKVRHAPPGMISFPAEDWFIVLAATACVSALLAGSSASAWLAWMKGIIPKDRLGRFFGIRQRYTMAALVGANLVASAAVGWMYDGQYVGYALIGTLAVLAAAASTLLLARVPPEPPVARERMGFVKIMLTPLRDARFRPVLLFGALFQFAVQLAGPYFPYFFTHDAGIAMTWVAGWTALTSLGSFAAAAYWGRRIDRTGDPGAVLFITGIFVAISPLFYLTTSWEWIRVIAPFDYFTNGMVACGYALALWTQLFAVVPESSSAVYFSMFSASLGLTGALANFLGGELALWLEPWGGFRALWVVAAALRMLVVLTLGRALLRRGEAPAPTQ